MIRIRYRIVDVFSARPLAGNALCVVTDPCPDPLMQAVAREVNLSETTFPVVTGEGAYDVRIFTPRHELPFAGHPSIGTAWVLGRGRWHQTSPGATVTVEADADGAEMSQPDPELRPVDPAPLAAALGLPGADAAVVASVGGIAHVLVATEARLDRLAPDPATVAAAAGALGATSLAPVRRLDDRTLHVRVFAPGAGVPEDPGTGSAAGPVGVFAAGHWGTGRRVTIHQGDEMGRPCRIEVDATPGAVRVGGRVAAAAEGAFTL